MGDIYYKVVAKSGRKMESCCPPVGAKVTYRKGKWSHPIDGTVGLLVFNDLKNARSWRGGGGAREVWECEIEGPAKEVKYLGQVSKEIKIFTWPDDPAEQRADILRRAATWEDGGFWINAPQGTLAVQGVKLLRKVA